MFGASAASCTVSSYHVATVSRTVVNMVNKVSQNIDLNTVSSHRASLVERRHACLASGVSTSQASLLLDFPVSL